MGLKSKLFGLGAALTLGLTLVGPAAASTDPVGTVPVSVSVADAGGTLTLGIQTTAVNFSSGGPLNLNASESTTSGVKNAGSSTLVLQISNDVALVNSPFDITIRLDDGGGHGAYLAPTGTIPSFEAGADVQIPGRYLKITDVGNPAQAKYSGTYNASTNPTGCANVWNGAGTTSSAQCAPRAATGFNPIYKTSDPVGLMGVADSGSDPTNPCRNTTVAFRPWPGTGCGDPTFSNASAKLIMHFRAGSGTVETLASYKLTLDVPAGVYPTTYQGVLTIEKVTTP